MFTIEELKLLAQIISNVKFQATLQTLETTIRPLVDLQKKINKELEKKNDETKPAKQDQASGRVPKKG